MLAILMAFPVIATPEGSVAVRVSASVRSGVAFVVFASLRSITDRRSFLIKELTESHTHAS